MTQLDHKLDIVGIVSGKNIYSLTERSKASTRTRKGRQSGGPFI